MAYVAIRVQSSSVGSALKPYVPQLLICMGRWSESIFAGFIINFHWELKAVFCISWLQRHQLVGFLLEIS